MQYLKSSACDVGPSNLLENLVLIHFANRKVDLSQNIIVRFVIFMMTILAKLFITVRFVMFAALGLGWASIFVTA